MQLARIAQSMVAVALVLFSLAEFNFSGYPVGSALAGLLAAQSLDVAIIAAVAACALSAVCAAILVPRQEAPAGRRASVEA